MIGNIEGRLGKEVHRWWLWLFQHHNQSMITWLQVTYQSTETSLYFEMSLAIVWSLISHGARVMIGTCCVSSANLMVAATSLGSSWRLERHETCIKVWWPMGEDWSWISGRRPEISQITFRFLLYLWCIRCMQPPWAILKESRFEAIYISSVPSKSLWRYINSWPVMNHHQTWNPFCQLFLLDIIRVCNTFFFFYHLCSSPSSMKQLQPSHSPCWYVNNLVPFLFELGVGRVDDAQRTI
jgi:hypothetical protein